MNNEKYTRSVSLRNLCDYPPPPCRQSVCLDKKKYTRSVSLRNLCDYPPPPPGRRTSCGRMEGGDRVGGNLAPWPLGGDRRPWTSDTFRVRFSLTDARNQRYIGHPRPRTCRRPQGRGGGGVENGRFLRTPFMDSPYGVYLTRICSA